MGTPAPVAPTEQLVVGGFYRHVRNPMYLALAAALVGQGLLLGQSWLLVYAAGFGVVASVFVRWYEEPTLRRRFGAQYERYRDAVPWLVAALPPVASGQVSWIPVLLSPNGASSIRDDGTALHPQ